VKLFKIERLNKAPAVFDYQKLEWFNGQYIRQKSDQDLAALVRPYLIEAGLRSKEDPEKDQIELAAMPLVRERLKFLADAPAIMAYLYRRLELPAIETYLPKKADAHEAAFYLEEDKRLLQTFGLEDIPSLEEKFRERAQEIGKKLGDLLMPLRVAITYTRVSPPLFESMKIIGLDESLARIERAIQYLQGD